MVAMVVSGSGSEGDHAFLCSNVYAMKHWSSNIHDHVPIVCRVSYIVCSSGHGVLCCVIMYHCNQSFQLIVLTIDHP